jgi:hypothetical protein
VNRIASLKSRASAAFLALVIIAGTPSAAEAAERAFRIT